MTPATVSHPLLCITRAGPVAARRVGSCMCSTRVAHANAHVAVNVIKIVAGPTHATLLYVLAAVQV